MYGISIRGDSEERSEMLKAFSGRETDSGAKK